MVAPPVRLWCGSALLRSRALPADHPALTKLSEDADAALAARPEAVTEKAALPPSGDPHDYQSLGPYWWPNPDTTDGLPYVRRDGEVNPESETQGDRARLGRTWGRVETLALAAFLLGREECGKHTALLLRTWFLDSATRMNPHLRYGQAIPGVCEGRDIGIIDTRAVGTLLDAVALLEAVGAWGGEDAAGLRAWMAAYLDWLRTSKHGRGEAGQHNNHGTWYDVQVASIALFVGREDVARAVLSAAAERRISAHIAPDGSQPHELARTRSFTYSVMNLSGLFDLATLGGAVGLNLWRWTPAGGDPPLRRALDYLLPTATEGRPWAHPQISPADPAALLLSLALRADRVYGGPYATTETSPSHLEHRSRLLF